jgi:hypothetical protein
MIKFWENPERLKKITNNTGLRILKYNKLYDIGILKSEVKIAKGL